MSAFESAPLATLSDRDAVSLLFELTGQGDKSGDKLVQLDAVVYARLAQTYTGDALPALRQDAT